ncbi:unnamed protein product [Parajaminaea phylloscopi]
MEAARASTSIPRDEPSSSDLLRSTDGRSSTPNGMPRPHHSRRAFGNDDDEDDDASGSHHRQRARHNKEHLTGYSHRGAERRDPAEPKRTPRVIPLSGAGSDWREERKRRLGLGKAGEVAGQRSSLPGGTHASSSSIGTNADRINDGEQRIGLQRPVRKEAAASVSNAEGKGDTNDHSDRTPPADATVGASTPSPGTAEQAHMLTDDERARKALLAGQFGSSSGFDSGRVIPLQQNAQLSEEDAFRQDAATRPDAPTLDDYAATPVEEFGKALLRGMGWQEGMGAGKGGKGPTAPTEVKKRSALLGLGASERPSAFGSGAGGPKPSNSNGHRTIAAIERGPEAHRQEVRVRGQTLPRDGTTENVRGNIAIGTVLRTPGTRTPGMRALEVDRPGMSETASETEITIVIDIALTKTMSAPGSPTLAIATAISNEEIAEAGGQTKTLTEAVIIERGGDQSQFASLALSILDPQYQMLSKHRRKAHQSQS